MPNITECGIGYNGWYWREKKRENVEAIRQMLAGFEQSAGSSFPKEARVSYFRVEFKLFYIIKLNIIFNFV
jgi:hypothetical protein